MCDAVARRCFISLQFDNGQTSITSSRPKNRAERTRSKENDSFKAKRAENTQYFSEVERIYYIE